jgi:hypothetical protein
MDHLLHGYSLLVPVVSTPNQLPAHVYLWLPLAPQVPCGALFREAFDQHDWSGLGPEGLERLNRLRQNSPPVAAAAAEALQQQISVGRQAQARA